ncbi:hypothetical protein ACFORL_12135 [Legionella dresdenensis]|uniref:Uncharacterized protein n=1 Tax=Legionella dresdenensis TaxID=450200 RepID=A0ABV8CI52_9GAMM
MTHPLFNRTISDFPGQCVVIGCSHTHKLCQNKQLHADPQSFYTIDINPEHHPDAVLNITQPLPAALEQRFRLTVVEQLDYYAYNASAQLGQAGPQGFHNIWQMTAPDGFILITGCPREQKYREQLYSRYLRYIELNESGNAILIPRDQSLAIITIRRKLKTLKSDLQALIKHARTDNRNKLSALKFCELSYENLLTLDETVLFGCATFEQKKLLLDSFSTIYAALDAGQKSRLNGRESVIIDALGLSTTNLKVIDHVTRRNPDSRTYRAWKLAKDHYKNCSAGNHKLFQEIRLYSLKRNGTASSFFKTSNSAGQNDSINFEQIVNQADAESWVGIIRDTLNSNSP